MDILVIDVGGTHINVLATGQKKPLTIRSGPKMSTKEMVRAVRQAPTDWYYSVASIGCPGPLLHGKPVTKLKAALEADDVVVGGGNAKRLRTLPRGAGVGSNSNASAGGYRLWKQHA